MAITQNDDGSITVKLAYPIQSEGETLSEVTLRRPKFKEVRQVESLGGAAALSKMIQMLAGLAPSSIDQVDVADLDGFREAIQTFLPSSPGTGAA